MKKLRAFWQPLSVAILVALAVFACFYPVRNFEFINFDDNIYVSENPFVMQGVTHEGLMHAFGDRSTGHWHPLTWISHMIDVELFGLNPGPLHLVNAGLHALNASLLFLFLVAATGALGPSLVAALIFGLHPMRIESVAWVSERKDVLSMFFGLLSLLSYLAWTRRQGAIGYGLTIVLFAFSLMAKPTFVTMPLLLLLLDIWPLKRLSKRTLLEKIPFWIMSIGFSAVVVYAQKEGQGLRDLSQHSLPDRVAGAFVSYQAYFAKLFYPSGIGVFYPNIALAPGIGAGALLGFMALSWCFIQVRKTAPFVTFGWLWFVISLLPLVGFVRIGGQIFADRWTYLPHIGLIVGAVWCGDSVIGSQLKIRQLSSSFIFVLCFCLTRYYLPFWQNSETLFRHTLEVSPDNFMAHTNLGSALDKAGRIDEAAEHYEEAARLNPTYPEALNNLGILRARQERLSEAAEYLSKAIAIRSNFISPRYNLGLVYSNQGDDLAALNQWLEILSFAPNDVATKNSIEFVLDNRLALPCEHALTSSTFSSHRAFFNALDSINARAIPESLWSKLIQLKSCF